MPAIQLRHPRISKVTRMYGRHHHRHSVVGTAQSQTLAWSAPAEPCDAATREDRVTLDFPPVAGHSGYAAIVDGDGLRVA